MFYIIYIDEVMNTYNKILNKMKYYPKINAKTMEYQQNGHNTYINKTKLVNIKQSRIGHKEMAPRRTNPKLRNLTC